MIKNIHYSFAMRSRTPRKELIWNALTFALAISGYIEFGPRNSYLIEGGRGFMSVVEACFSSKEGSLALPNSSTLVRDDGTCLIKSLLKT